MPGPAGHLSLFCKQVQLLADHGEPRPAVFLWPITGHLERSSGPAPENQQVPGLREVQLENSQHATRHQERCPMEAKFPQLSQKTQWCSLQTSSVMPYLSVVIPGIFLPLSTEQANAAHVDLFGPQPSRRNPHILLLLR